jgi:hypothetical protein
VASHHDGGVKGDIDVEIAHVAIFGVIGQYCGHLIEQLPHRPHFSLTGAGGGQSRRFRLDDAANFGNGFQEREFILHLQAPKQHVRIEQIPVISR